MQCRDAAGVGETSEVGGGVDAVHPSDAVARSVTAHVKARGTGRITPMMTFRVFARGARTRTTLGSHRRTEGRSLRGSQRAVPELCPKGVLLTLVTNGRVYMECRLFHPSIPPLPRISGVTPSRLR